MKHIFIILFFITFSNSNSLADGFFVWRNQKIDIAEPQQKAFIVFDEGIENLVIEVKFEGAPEEFGWIIPLPSVPDISKSTNSLFPLLSQLTQDPYFKMSEPSRIMTQPLGFSTGLTTITFQVGIYDVAILQDGQLSELTDWLTENEFYLKDGSSEILDQYLKKGWVFSAIKIRPDQINKNTGSQLANGKIQPLTFTFATEKPIFPLKISAISGKPSEILIYTFAESGIVPQDQEGVQWETHARHFVPWDRFFAHGLFSSIHERFKERMHPIALIKSRAVFQAHQMVDIEFELYNPHTFLVSDHLRPRVEAVTALGTGIYPNSAQSLLSFLENSDFVTDLTFSELIRIHTRDGLAPGQDVRSAIWALGELKNQGKLSDQEVEQAGEVIRKWGRQGDRWTIFESLIALVIISPEKGADFAMELLPQLTSSDHGTSDRQISTLCGGILADHGSSHHYPALKSLINQYYDPQFWDSNLASRQNNHQTLRLGRMALQVAAICGDDTAYQELESQLLKTAQTESFQWLLANDKLYLGSYQNGYPAALAPGLAILSEDQAYRYLFADLPRNLNRAKDVQNRIFRKVAHSRNSALPVPDDFRAILLAHLKKLNKNDEDLLIEIWNKSMHPPQRVKLKLRKPREVFKDTELQFNINALAVSYALGVQDNVELLFEFWGQTSWGYLPEKAELAFAFALTDNSDALEPLMQYVRHTWGILSKDSQIQLALEADAGKIARKSKLVSFEPDFRQSRINKYLAKHGLNELWEMISEDDCPAYLRYYFLLHRRYKFQVSEAEMNSELLRLKNNIPSPNIQKRINDNLK